MMPLRIQHATHNAIEPEGWGEQRDGKCGTIAVRAVRDEAGGWGYCETAWEPLPGELAKLNAGGRIILRVCGWQVPVNLYVESLDEGANHAG
jgi:hypothetical protein